MHVQSLNARMLLGEEVDLTKHAQAVCTLVRVASRLPIGRRAKDITPSSLGEYLARKTHTEAAE